MAEAVTALCGTGHVDPRILDLGTIWRWVVSFTSWLLYPRGKRPRYPLHRSLGAPQNRSERSGDEKNPAPAETGTPFPRQFNPLPVVIQTAPSRVNTEYKLGISFTQIEGCTDLMACSLCEEQHTLLGRQKRETASLNRVWVFMSDRHGNS
jgi:hypothetical protein